MNAEVQRASSGPGSAAAGVAVAADPRGRYVGRAAVSGGAPARGDDNMTDLELQKPKFSERDLDFVVEGAAPEFKDKTKLKRLITEDEAFRKGLVGDEKVFKKVMTEEDAFLKISPPLYFEILLRKALKELERASHTVERTGTQVVAVFDTKEVVELFAREVVVDYLAEMMSSFTRVESYSIPVRVREGTWRKLRFNDMDIDSLTKFAEAVEEEYRFGFYKRIADVCLFTLGVFPEYAHFDYRYPFSGEARPAISGRARRGMEEYEEEGRKFYKLAADHRSAADLGLTEVMGILRDKLNVAKKPLNFVSDHYLNYKKTTLFGLEAQ